MKSMVAPLILALCLTVTAPVTAQQNDTDIDGLLNREDGDTTAHEDVEFGPTLVREDLIGAVLERNPGMAQAQNAWQAAAERPDQVKAWEDLRAMYAFGPQSIGSDRFGWQAAIEQRFPWFGKKGFAQEAAEANADALAGEFATVQLQLAYRASLLFDDYFLIERALEVNQQHIDLLSDLKKSAESMYAAGLALQVNPLQADVELAHTEHARLILQADRDIVRARINGLLHRAPESPLPPPPDAQPVPRLETLVDTALADSALVNRPDLRSIEARVLSAEASRRLAGREYWPDFSLFLSHNTMWQHPDHRTMLGIRLNVPLQLGRRGAAAREAEANIKMWRNRHAVLSDQVRVDVIEARRRAREAIDIAALYEERLVPVSRDQVNAARSAFEAGRLDFSRVIDAEKNLRTVELEYLDAIASAYRHLADLDRTVGVIPFLGIEPDLTRLKEDQK
ncbi:MAG: TolC family protein [Candidatus Latescibacterota bacterium]|nr:MAG: TolC family protein [Candidatus Latescibacterota bacterium]